MSEFLIDANLPKRLRFWHDDACEFLPDHTIWRYARERKLTIVTKDHDFEQLALAEGSPTVILLCAGPMSRRELWQLLEKWWLLACEASRQPGCRLVRIYPGFIESI